MLHGQGWKPVNCTEVKGEDIIIGNDVWIANNVTILQGAQIDDGAVIGAFSIVGGHIPAYTIAVGNPCRIVRKRFSDEHIAKLLEIQWWNWDMNTINKHLHIISSPDIDALYDIWKSEIKT
jgi:carbonic anhydrase/acetyltransferase-like protein (isoleucine patch superfamily)